MVGCDSHALCPPSSTGGPYTLPPLRLQVRVARKCRVVPNESLSPHLLQGMGYLHAKGILHKDLKSKNVFYDNGKVVITDFGLFSISGVLQAGR